MTKILTVSAFLVAFLVASAASPAAGEPNPHNGRLCLLCHKETPLFGVDTRATVSFRGNATWDDPQLCAHCHKPAENLHPLLVEPGPERLGTRIPSTLPLGEAPGLEGKVVCTTCHFLHASQSDHALLRGFPGSQQPNRFGTWQDFCRDCHGEGLAKRSPHQGDEQACAFCHQTRPEEGKPVDVAPRSAQLCNFCHGGVRDGHYAKTNPFDGEVGCLDCHGPHLGPENPARLKPAFFDAAREKTTVSPHYRRTLCFSCHGEGEGYPLLNDDSVVLCNRCHGTGEIVGDIHPLRKVPEHITPPAQWPLSRGFLTCLTCHSAGHMEDAGKWKFLRGGPYGDRNDFCRNCHDPNSYGDRNPHRDINRGEGCEFCHAVRPVPGKDTIDTVKFIADPNLLCLRCHAENPHPAGVEHTMTVEPDRAALFSSDYPVYRGNKIVCATCHNPHVEETENHKLRGEGVGMLGCAGCHRY